jgi:ribonuclease HI
MCHAPAVWIGRSTSTHTCISAHVADGNTNNDGEWMAVSRAAQYVSEHGLTDVEIATDSMVVTNQLSNNVGANEPRHAAVHDATAALLANCPRWRIRHVHRECNCGADAMWRQWDLTSQSGQE